MEAINKYTSHRILERENQLVFIVLFELSGKVADSEGEEKTVSVCKTKDEPVSASEK